MKDYFTLHCCLGVVSKILELFLSLLNTPHNRINVTHTHRRAQAHHDNAFIVRYDVFSLHNFAIRVDGRTRILIWAEYGVVPTWTECVGAHVQPNNFWTRGTQYFLPPNILW